MVQGSKNSQAAIPRISVARLLLRDCRRNGSDRNLAATSPPETARFRDRKFRISYASFGGRMKMWVKIDLAAASLMRLSFYQTGRAAR